ncbi:MAG: TIGR03118 family protein [Acidobacteriaceae bacterium]|nr:TIGR03118 family protein [Acidobacteriaceae bacterium]MBV9779807.1 TIGR03118 family protein [Acidobacteriaceae bacterium]
MAKLCGARLRVLKIGLCALALSTLGFAQHYTQTDLVTDAKDPNLQNPWGLVASSGGPWWVSDENDGLSTLYDGAGHIQSLVVKVPSGSGKGTGHPTGIMFNGKSTDFLLSPGNPAFFIYVTLDGTVSGWNPGVSASSAVIKVNNSSKGAVYTGATIGEIGENEMIYVANFHTGKVEVYNSSFKPVTLSKNAFIDATIPQDFAPFNIQGIGPNLYVTYAKQNSTKTFPVDGAGLGFVDVYSPQGTLLQRLQHGSWLNAPWGVVLAPADFGEFSHALLVGDFLGTGTIAAYNSVNGQFLGNMLTPKGALVEIPGLWTLTFGHGNSSSGAADSLYFTAGGGPTGLLGTLKPISTELNEDDEQ